MHHLRALPLAVLVTGLLFWFIHSLIDFTPPEIELLQPLALVDSHEPAPEQEQEQEQEQAPEPEPLPEQLYTEASAPAPALPDLPLPAAPRLEAPAMQALDTSDLQLDVPPGALDNLVTSGGSGGWAPSGASAAGLKSRLEAARSKQKKGFRDVIPVGSRQPDVPKEAWERKIDGWVVVAFVVGPNGRVRNVQVVDSSPRGVFEANVVDAVSDWVYDGNREGKSFTLTQRIELFWRDYPHNVKRPGQQ